MLSKEEKRAFRRYRLDQSQVAEEEYKAAKKAKGAAIKSVKQRSFEEALENASRNGGKIIWHLAERVQSKSILLLAQPFIPTFTTLTGPATTPVA